MSKYGSDRPDMRDDKNNPDLLAFCWITDFPFFESTKTSDHNEAVGEWTFTHNPFSAAKQENLELLLRKKDMKGRIVLFFLNFMVVTISL